MTTQISKVQIYWLILKLYLSCAYYAIKAIILTYFLPNNCKTNNKIITDWASSLIKPLKINFVYNNFQLLNNLPKNKPIILMSNHSSAYDIPIIINAMPQNITLRMLAKKELRKIPLFGQAMIKLGFPIVDRKNTKQAIIDLEQTKQIMQNGTVIWAAPEGTRSKDNNLLPFKKGVFIMAIETKAMIIPIGINGANAILPTNTFNLSLNKTITLSVGRPIDTADYTIEDCNKIKELTREEILRNI